MRKNLCFFVAISVISVGLFVTSCKKSDSSDSSDSTTKTTTSNKAVNFLKVGNQWVYSCKSVVSAGYYNDTTKSEVTDKIVQDMGNGDFKLVAYLSASGANITSDSVKYSVDADYLYRYQSLSSNVKYKLMSSNPSAGQTYSNVINGDTITETVMGSEKITVAAGTFTCWKIKEVHSYNGSTAYAWIDKDAGVIKESATISSSYYTSSTIMELKSKNF